MTPTPDEVAALVRRLRDILKFDDDLTEDDKLRLEAADALESISPPAGMEQIRALVKSALTASDNSLRWYIEQIDTATQAGQNSAAAPSQEGHAVGPASAVPPAGMVKDAERYRWLRSKVGTEVGQGDVLVYIIDREQVFQEPLRAQIDAAIDAARLSARERKE